LAVLVINYLQNRDKLQTISTISIGENMVSLFRLYGYDFNFDSLAVGIEGGGYLTKKET